MARFRTVGFIAIIVLVVVAGSAAFLLTRGDSDGSSNDDTTSVANKTATIPNSAGSPASGGDQAAALVTAASKQWDATNSAHFNLKVDGKTFLDSANTLQLLSADGDILRPDSVQTTVKIDVALASFDVKIIAIGDEMYMTSFVTGKWGPAPADLGYNPAVLFSPTEGISAVLVQLNAPTLGGTETVEGRETQVVNATTTGDDIKAMTAGGLQGDLIDATLWIATDNSDIMKIMLTAPAASGGSPTTWTLVITNQNEPVTIAAPVE